MDIEARGYANHVNQKTSKAGKPYQTFSLGVKQKEKAFGDRPETVTWANLQVTDFTGADVADRAYVTIKGRLKVREYEKDGQKRQALEVFANEVEVAPPLDGAARSEPKAKAPAGDKDPWD